MSYMKDHGALYDARNRNLHVCKASAYVFKHSDVPSKRVN